MLSLFRLLMLGIFFEIQAMEKQNCENDVVDHINISDLQANSEQNKKNRVVLKRLYHSHPILGFKDLRSIIEAYLNDTVYFVLQTPHQVTGFFKDWQPAYPPIHSLQFKDNELIAHATGNENGYDYVITWNLNNHTCHVDYSGSKFTYEVDAYSFFLKHRDRYNAPYAVRHNQLTATVSNLPLTGLWIMPHIQHTKEHRVTVSLPRMLMWQSIMSGKNYVALNNELFAVQQPPLTPNPQSGKIKTD